MEEKSSGETFRMAQGISQVIVRSVAGKSLTDTVRECMEFCEWKKWVARDSKVVLKPNLCTAVPERIEAANTEARLTAAVCEVLLERTSRISIVETDHVRQTAEQVFEASGYGEIAKKFGVKLVNLSKMPTVGCDCEPVGEIHLPRILLEGDTFISLPVLKTHALTYFTGVLKNQWGCVPRYFDRIQHHGHIHELLSSLHRILQPRFSVMDALVCVEGRGPVFGPARRLDLILASRDGVALDSTAMRLVGLDPNRCSHVVIAAKKGLGRIDAQEIVVNGDWDAHATNFQPAPKDWANTAMFYLAKHRWFFKFILANDRIYYPVRSVVQFIRRVRGFES
ncbi:MAG: DUF362 domain-containing protein [Terriglobales bacterium]